MILRILASDRPSDRQTTDLHIEFLARAKNAQSQPVVELAYKNEVNKHAI
jgi:hypothetical protein